jgi:glycosyltransferase involved in cell wall biosynthesis
MYLAEELATKGHEVHVLHSIDAYRTKRKSLKDLKLSKKENMTIHSLESAISQKEPLLAYAMGNSPLALREFAKIISKEHPDIVHHHNISLLGYKILNKEANYVNVYTAHDYWLICQTNNLMRKNGTICSKKDCYSCALAWKRIPQFWRKSVHFKKALAQVDIMISPSDFLREKLVDEINIRSFTLPNFVPPPPESNLKPDFVNYFLFVGMLEEHKGIKELLKVFKEVNKNLDASLIIVGRGNLEKYVTDYITNNSLKNVIYLGFVEKKQLFSLYANALALIIPSIWPENAPLVTLEALSVGTPIIASNYGGLPEITQKAHMSPLVFNDFNELKKILISFHADLFDKSEIKRCFNAYFSKEAFIENYMNVISETKLK